MSRTCFSSLPVDVVALVEMNPAGNDAARPVHANNEPYLKTGSDAGGVFGGATANSVTEECRIDREMKGWTADARRERWTKVVYDAGKDELRRVL